MAVRSFAGRASVGLPTRNSCAAAEEQPVSKLNQSDRDHLEAREFAFPKQRKAPLEDASHVRNAVARFDQVKDVSDAERDEAWKRIQKAAKKFDVELEERSWRELGKPSD